MVWVQAPFKSFKDGMIPLSITFLKPKILGKKAFFLRKIALSGEWNLKKFPFFTLKIFFFENIENLREIVHEWKGDLEIFSCPQVTENSRRYLPLRTDILQKTVFGCPWPWKISNWLKLVNNECVCKIIARRCAELQAIFAPTFTISGKTISRLFHKPEWAIDSAAIRGTGIIVLFKIQLVGQKYRDKTTLASKKRFSRYCFGFQSWRFSLLVGYNI